MTPFERLTCAWRTDAEKLEEYGDERLAKACRRHAEQLEAAVRQSSEETLTLASASVESGYSPDRLRHMIGEGLIPNAGRRGSPRIRRGDLPRKPKPTNDPAVRARQLLSPVRHSSSL